MARLGDIARIVRSKNAGPFTLTIDVIFTEPSDYERYAKCITPERVARLYNVGIESVEVIHYRPALAVKVNLPRSIPSGHPGDTDVYGAQQHAPLLGLELGECG
ncbi:MAG: DUF4387 domain-containing protein [Desulfurococcales archaeon]|nr:DUF4387 domain-containing protein [Desulfurococcales archaeon]